MEKLLIYGANGYTGRLISQNSIKTQLSPILAGRDNDSVGELAQRLGLEYRVFDLNDSHRIDEGLKGVSCVLNCAGPFFQTSRPMVEASIRNHVHYLDITGEITVFEKLAARDEEAKKAGVMLLPGVGFDVVPTDCLAAHLKARLPLAESLVLGLKINGSASRGTIRTAFLSPVRKNVIRKDRIMREVSIASRVRKIDFGNGQEWAIGIPWGDISTAYFSTGIPNIEVYIAGSRKLFLLLIFNRLFGWSFNNSHVRKIIESCIDSMSDGPSVEERSQRNAIVWGQAQTRECERVTTLMHTPEGYELTASTALAVSQKVMAGKFRPGFQTPSRVYGKDFILEIKGVTRQDVL